MINGNPQLENGKKFDSGKIFIDSNGVARTILRKQLEVSAFGNATAVNIAHGENPDLTAGSYAKVVSIMGTNGTQTLNEDDVTSVMDATNVILTSTGNLSGYVGHVIIEFINPLS